MNIEIKKVKVKSLLAEKDLFTRHYDEIAKNKSVMILNPDEEKYLAIEKNNKLLCLAAFDGDSIVGYSISIIDNHLHYMDLVVCMNDVLFVDPVYRKSRCGILLIKNTEQFASDMGAKMLLWHAKSNTALDHLMPKIGYAVQEIIYSKVIT